MMMRKLPSVKAMADAVMKTRRGGQSVSESVEFLLKNRADLEYFQDLEDYVFASGPTAKYRGAFEHHALFVRQHLLKVLWSREIFIGPSVIDALLFQALAHRLTANPVRWVIEYIRDQGLHGPGLVVYPLHSVGVLGAGLFRWFTKADVRFIAPEFGLGLTPQTNHWERTWKFLDHARASLGVSRALPRELIEHWSRSRPIRWLTQNPVLVVLCRSFPGDYYENQALLIVKLQFATSLCFMLASLEPDAGLERRQITEFSSSGINNFQTLDIRHYLVFHPSLRQRGRLSGDCVPIHGRPAALSDLSDLAIEIDPRYWRRSRWMASRVYAALGAAQTGYLKHRLGVGDGVVEGRIYRKLFDALLFFRRSFRPERPDECVVHLATAFETLVTDSYAAGVGKRLAERCASALRGVPGRKAMVAAVEALHEARSAIVHQGRHDMRHNLTLARRAFAHTFVGLTSRLGRLRTTSPDHPIEDLLRP
jgi:hypothetical protein